MSTLVEWFCDNWSSIIKRALVAVPIIAFGYYFIGLHTDLRDAEKASQKWESNYRTVNGTLKTTQESLAAALQEKENLEKVLKKRDEIIVRLETEATDAQEDIRKLGEENEEIRALLTTRIPDSLWRKIFPARRDSGNEGGKSQGSGQSAPAVP